jgi:hypothetical protein
VGRATRPCRLGAFGRRAVTTLLLRRAPLLAIALALASPACWNFQKDVPEGPSALPPARYATVDVQYRQPRGCSNLAALCETRVVFFGSWMQPGEEVLLDPQPGLVWTGEAKKVPVNWPPADSPHLVRVFDPHLTDTPTGGVTAARLSVGGQILTEFDSPGTASESAYVYIDDLGVGHNPP